MTPEQQAVIDAAKEYARLTIPKVGVTVSLPAKTALLAAVERLAAAEETTT